MAVEYLSMRIDGRGRTLSAMSLIALIACSALAWQSPPRPDFTIPTTAPAAADNDAAVASWPRNYIRNATIDKQLVEQRVIVYQPQVDSWRKYHDISFRCALAVHRAPDVEPEYGLVEVKGTTAVDADTRRVLIEDTEIVYRFPGVDPAVAAECEQLARDVLPQHDTIDASLDMLLACIDAPETRQREVKVSIDPPTIFYSKRAAILVTFRGDPDFRPIAGSSLMYATNCNWDVLVDPSTATSYLLYGESWLKTRDLNRGPWEPARDLPAAFFELPQKPEWGDVRAQLPGKPLNTMPVVFMSRTPAEIIVTDGDPEYESLKGIRLKAVRNTDAALFRHAGDLNFYYLAAGRWFRAKSLEGPWAAATTDLPVDFKQIPRDCDWEYVRASVPGTDEAADAVMLASVPRRATVNINEVSLELTYDGTPRFATIPDTTIEAALNTDARVFRSDGRYYCCQDAVWFESSQATGPWAACKKVPEAIYAIPPTNPAHNVTYASIIDSTEFTVDVGYTSGYDNALVTAGVLVLGAGVVAAVIAADDVNWNVHGSFGGNTISSYGSGAFYDSGIGGFCRSGREYGPYAGTRGGAAWNRSTGTLSRYGNSASSGGSGLSVSVSSYGERLGGANRFSAWNKGVVARDNDRSGIGRASADRGRSGWTESSDNRADARRGGRDGDLYVGRDGQVYKRDGNGNWQERSGKEWRNANAGGRNSLDADALSRGRGLAASDRASSLGRGGGAARGGRGGGGRRGR